jgi:hypothetical protein
MPWLLMAVVLSLLRGKPLEVDDWSGWAAFRLVPRAMFPGLIPFGCYRIWLSIIQERPSWFYVGTRDELIVKLQYILKKDPTFLNTLGPKDKSPEKLEALLNDAKKDKFIDAFEPSVESLGLQLAGAEKNLGWGVVYIITSLAAGLIPR